MAGTAATLTQGRAAVWHDDDLARRFARFRQGLPTSFDPESLAALPALTGRPPGYQREAFGTRLPWRDRRFEVAADGETDLECSC